MDDRAINWIANEGVRVSRIVKHIKNQSLGSPGHRLREQMFEAVPTMAAQTPNMSSGGALGPPRISSSLEEPHIKEGVATWIIPLSISVKLGGTRLMQDFSQQAATGHAKPTQPPTEPSLPAPSTTQDEELRAYLEEARQARTRPYYDKKVDAKDKKSYYADLSSSLSPDKLFSMLSDMVRRTHATKPRYKPSKELYP